MILPEPHAINRLRHALTRMETAIAGTSFLLLLALVFRHIRLDVVAAILPEKLRDVLRCPLYLLSSLLCAVFAWAAWRFWYDDWQYVAEHERWSSILALITPFGFCLIAFNFLIAGLFVAAPGDARR